jgi:hypothetical protein
LTSTLAQPSPRSIAHPPAIPAFRREVERAVNKGRNIITFRIENVVRQKSL